LSQEQRTQALATIFGSDATRAATVLMNEGSKGLEKFIKATRDQGAAQKMANANMSGTAGALEQLSGSIDTAKLKLGEALAPTVQRFAKYLSNVAVPAFSKFIDQMQSGKGAGGALAHDLGLVADAAKTAAHWGLEVGKAFSSLPDWAKKGLILGGGAAALASKVPGVKGLLGAGAKAAGVTGPRPPSTRLVGSAFQSLPTSLTRRSGTRACHLRVCPGNLPSLDRPGPPVAVSPRLTARIWPTSRRQPAR
jgi:hypothetical protein